MFEDTRAFFDALCRSHYGETGDCDAPAATINRETQQPRACHTKNASRASMSVDARREERCALRVYAHDAPQARSAHVAPRRARTMRGAAKSAMMRDDDAMRCRKMQMR